MSSEQPWVGDVKSAPVSSGVSAGDADAVSDAADASIQLPPDLDDQLLLEDVEHAPEWFSLDDDPDEGIARLPRRHHHVTAVVVGHNGSTWLPAVMSTVGSQTRPVDAVIGVDTSSTDSTGAILRSALGADRVIETPNFGFGRAVGTGLEAVGPVVTVRDPEAGELITWIWLLHDDSAPDAACLQSLLDTADDFPGASILGPKILGWHDRRLLLEVGVSITGAGRRFTGLENGEHDQGQHDGIREVMSVSSAGMLVRRDVWERLQGFDPQLPLFRDDLDFCWRAHLAGERILIATDAVVHHREASAHGRRQRAGSAEAQQRPHRLDRESAVHVLLARLGVVSASFEAVRLLLGSAMHSIAYVLGKDFQAARDEIGAVLDVAMHPGRLRFSRLQAENTTIETNAALRHLRPSAGSQVRHVLENVAAIATTSDDERSVSIGAGGAAMESGPVDEAADYLTDGGPGFVRRLLLRPGVLLFAGLAVFSVVATHALWWGDGVLQGGALLPSPAGAGDVWESYTQAWHNVSTGSATPSSPYLLLVFALAAVVLGKAPLAVSIVLLACIPIAGWSAYFVMRGAISSTAVRVWAAIAYALLPAVTVATSSGRLGTAIVAIALPFTVRSFVRILSPGGTTRRAAGTALLLAIVTCAVPGLWLVALAAALVAAVVGHRGASDRGVRGWSSAVNRRLVIAVVGPMLVLFPWSGYLLMHPVLFWLEAGGTQVTPGAPGTTDPWQIFLLHPGGPGSVPAWASVGIVVAALVALTRGQRTNVVAWCWLVAGTALVIGVAECLISVTPPGASTGVHPWAGPATLLLGGALIGAAAVAADGLRADIAGASFTVAQPVIVITLLLAVLSPAVVAIAWLPNAQGVMRKADASAVPAFVAADAASPAAPRTLMLTQSSTRAVTYALINGSGPTLGDADVTPGSAVVDTLDALVADLVSGRGGPEINDLAGFGVRYVLLARGSQHALVPILDAEPGLRRVSTNGGDILWQMSGLTSRARLLAGDQSSPVPLVSPGDASTDPYISVIVPAGQGARTLITGATADSGWRAVVTDERTGDRLQLDAGQLPPGFGWTQGYVLPASRTQISVSFEAGPRHAWMVLQLLIVIVFVVLALPSRTVVDVDPDVDGDEPYGSERAA